ncbi:flavodoxin family protein [Candidatus Methanoperedens nitratireducens]|uniref:NADPH-dependent FMN reductase family protein n=1 Tax=Candidatus Methanoperedens nitratireducens TaxID=1392998 RepID=A0A284VNF5_9EURY|nr:flavodoxin family protein [Candidatus Methanoperedens nitroreducens]SNQ60821.1 NADPH-dependent FMN reductase family protein [Candidatus Methanoperedens nitroreducens]
MKILGIVGSPRKGSSTDLLVDMILKGAVSRGAAVEKINISDLNLAFCTGCMECRQTGICRVTKEDSDDDLTRIIDKIAEADGLVLASPVYIRHVPGQFKNLFDRLVSQIIITPGKNPPEIKCRIPGKRNSVVLATCGNPDIKMAAETLEFLKNSAFICGNGGNIVSELAVGGLMLPCQINADERRLLEYASNFNIPEPVVDNMMKQYKSVKEQAYQSGQKLALMEK